MGAERGVVKWRRGWGVIWQCSGGRREYGSQRSGTRHTAVYFLCMNSTLCLLLFCHISSKVPITRCRIQQEFNRAKVFSYQRKLEISSLSSSVFSSVRDGKERKRQERLILNQGQNFIPPKTFIFTQVSFHQLSRLRYYKVFELYYYEFSYCDLAE